MKRFSDLEIPHNDKQTIFNVPVVSIQEVVNCEIEVIAFEANVKTKHGDGRYIIKFRQEGVERKFFTNSSYIKEDIEKVDKEDFPFLTTIKIKSFGSGSGKSFQFT